MNMSTVHKKVGKRGQVALRRTFSLIVGATLFAMVATACSSPGGDIAPTSDSETSQELEHVLIRLDFTPWGAHAPFYQAQELGYYKDAGLDVEIGIGQGSPLTAKTVAAGSDDLGYVNIATAVSVIGEGAPAKVVYIDTNETSWGLYVGKDTGITTLEGLYGKKVLASTGGLGAVMLEAIFNMQGLDLGKVDLERVGISSLTQLYSQKKADAMGAAFSYSSSSIQERRPTHVIKYSELGLKLADYGIIANQKMIDERPDVIQRFIDATAKGYEAAVKDPSKAFDAILKVSQAASLEQLQSQWTLTQEVRVDDENESLPIGCSAPGIWEATIDTLSKYVGLEDTEIDTYYDAQFSKRCL